jgi:hypothetical protein
MATIHEDSDWSVAQKTGQRRWLRPFEESNAQIIFEQDYTQSAASWVAANVNLGIANPDYPSFYLVAESTPVDMGGGMYRFTRTWSQIPAARTEFESFAFTFPGMEVGVLYAVNAVTGNTGVNANGTTTLQISGGGAIAAGDSVRIKYNAIDNVQQFTAHVIRTAISGGSTLVVDQIVDTRAVQPLYYFWAQKIELGREPRTETVASTLTYEYFLPGVSAGVSSVADISIVVKDIIIDGEGLQTDTYSETTTPSLSDYREVIADGALIVAEDSIVRRWKGPIFQKVTRYVKAK